MTTPAYLSAPLARKYNIAFPTAAPTTADAVPLASMAGAAPGQPVNQDKPYHPDSPLFWVGALLLATFGLIYGATEVRVGPAKADLSLGKK